MTPATRLRQAVVLAVTLAVASVGIADAAQISARGFSGAGLSAQEELESAMAAELSSARIEEHLRWLTSRPHLTGSPESRLTAEYLHQNLVEYGFRTDTTEYDAFLPASIETEAETFLRDVPTAESLGRHLLYLTEEPHPTGSERNLKLADYVRDRFRDYGLEEVGFHDTPALVATGRTASVELVAPVEMRLKLAEDPYAEDKDSFLYQDPAVVPFHEYAASGTVTAEVVYANGGSPEDFARLEEMGISVRGKIVVMRYSVPYSYRGYKVYMAEKLGAAGAIIYSDPQDDGYRRGEIYPHGPWGPASHIQWGSIVYDWFGFGVTPFTFHWRQQSDGTWVEGALRDRQLPRIPSLPLSHESAAEILARLRGPVAPAEWQGALPFTYRIGPGPVRLRLQVENDERVVTMRNVIGMVRGGTEPNKWVIIGNHRDAWNYGAVDPSSGTAALLETARAIGAGLAKGLRPSRSIVFANWDAEEDLLGGSTSWVKDHRDKLARDGVVYVNVDHAARGPEFRAGATPALADFLRDVTRSIHDPESGGSLFDAWARGSADGQPQVETIVGATDYTAFQEHLGMSCIDMSFDGPYGVYHSQYDNYFWLTTIGDPGLRYNTTMARLMTLVVWRLANAEVLPLRSSRYAAAVLGHLEEIEDKAAPERSLRLESAREAAIRWQEAATGLEVRLDRLLMESSTLDQSRSERLNAVLMSIERAMTEPEGLASRPFFKHLIYAPQPTYRKEVLPRLFEAIESGSWNQIERFENQLVSAFDSAVELIRQGEALLED